MKLDSTDIKILEVMQKDGRITTKALADQLNLSTTPVFERVKRLEREGIIKQYVALLDNRKLDLMLTAFISISLTKHSRSYLEKFVNEVNQYPEVMECYHIAGNFDFLLKIVVKNMEIYEAFILNKLSTIANLGQVQSSFVLSKNIHKTAYSI
ncbi:Lrp/AsnC family transcriptional regulator [Roseivirga misakiensis]|uniref:AsnC family transcriptional regulator n=1 Tax=Roseivirga misakiensis TaxID=1563681 RepID=A0A1E5T4B7_9BACT|nr:Lrp/AsnC family transcriptional regulator [Roseivirga misakiensis]OEK06224.1 AsnC family transcriptional regulator [Roseivirga misakiensis]